MWLLTFPLIHIKSQVARHVSHCSNRLTHRTGQTTNTAVTGKLRVLGITHARKTGTDGPRFCSFHQFWMWAQGMQSLFLVWKMTPDQQDQLWETSSHHHPGGCDFPTECGGAGGTSFLTVRPCLLIWPRLLLTPQDCHCQGDEMRNWKLGRLNTASITASAQYLSAPLVKIKISSPNCCFVHIIGYCPCCPEFIGLLLRFYLRIFLEVIWQNNTKVMPRLP